MRVKYKNKIITVDRCEYVCNDTGVYYVKLMNNVRVVYFEFETSVELFISRLLTDGWIDLDTIELCGSFVKSNPIIMGE